MKKIQNILFVLAIMMGIGAMIPASVYAAPGDNVDVISAQCDGVDDSNVCSHEKDSPGVLVKKIVNVLLPIVGSLAVVVLIIGGILYATSAGDSGKVTIAKNTVTYAIVGVIVTAIAYAVVQFIFDKFTATS